MEGHGHSGPTLHGLALPEVSGVGRTIPSYLVSDVISCQDGVGFPLYHLSGVGVQYWAAEPLLLGKTIPFIPHTITSCKWEHTLPPSW